MLRRRTTLCLLLLVAGVAWAQGRPAEMTAEPAQWESPGNSYIHVEVVPSLSGAPVGEAFHIAVKLTIDEGWVLYSPDPGATDLFAPLAGEVVGESSQLEFDQALWQMDEQHSADAGDGEIIISNVYQGGTVVYLPARVLSGAGGEANATITLSGQLCSDASFQCLNVEKTASVTVRVSDAAIDNPAWTGELARGLGEAVSEEQLRLGRAARSASGSGDSILSQVGPNWSLWTGLAIAVLAGLILNVMPCVLPVIPIRVMSLVDAAHGSRGRFVSLGLAFSGGIVLFFVGLGVVNVVLRLATAGVLSWGRHFQLESFRIALGMLMVALACNLFGLFNVIVPRRLMEMDSGVSARAGGHVGAAGMGLMMAVLATPCSFALLMSVLGWAAVQPIWLGTTAIVLMGGGMAAPHAVLTAFPSLVSKLPKPGRWMELLKQGMGFAILAVAAWLVGTLSETSYVMRVTIFGVTLAFALWMWGAWVRYDAPLGRKLVVRAGALAVVIVAGIFLLPSPAPLAVEFEPFSQARIADAGSEGSIVLVKFSATWCISCKWVDRTIYDNQDVARQLLDLGVVTIKGDVSESNSPANALLYGQLKGAPPLTVIYPPGDGPAIRLEGKFSRADLTAALDRAARDIGASQENRHDTTN